eukprot:scaffold2214_cov139-Cylindrotheca_fusiformis.AAC.17
MNSTSERRMNGDDDGTNCVYDGSFFYEWYTPSDQKCCFLVMSVVGKNDMSDSKRSTCSITSHEWIDPKVCVRIVCVEICAAFVATFFLPNGLKNLSSLSQKKIDEYGERSRTQPLDFG